MSGQSSPSLAGPAAPTPFVQARRTGALAHLTLDRPAALNALHRDMQRTLAEAFKRWGSDPEIYAFLVDSAVPQAFSVGVDPADLADPGARLDEILAVLTEQTQLLWQIECGIKPSAWLLDGIVSGTAAGLVMLGTHRIAGEGYRFVMPATGLGTFPDAGASVFLGSLPGHIGLYLALTGATIERADAYALGLVTHCIDRAAFGDIRAALADADPIDPVLDSRHADPGPGSLSRRRVTIAHCFGQASVGEIVAALGAVTGEDRDWARQTAASLAERAPTSLSVTLRQLRTGRGLSLKAALEREYGMAVQSLVHPDFLEGLRLQAADKGARPRWQPATLADVTPAMVDSVFADVGDRALVLPPRPQSLVALGLVALE